MLALIGMLAAAPGGAEDSLRRAPKAVGPQLEVERPDGIEAPTEGVKSPARRTLQPTAGPKSPIQRQSPTARDAAHGLGQQPTRPGPTRLGASPTQGATGLPDLAFRYLYGPSQPEGLPGTGMCGPAAAGGLPDRIRFTILNASDTDAPRFTTAVHWEGPNGFGLTVRAYVPGIPAGGSQNMHYDLPDECWGQAAHGSCNFHVEIDSNGEVEEFSEGVDNFKAGVCIKPGT